MDLDLALFGNPIKDIKSLYNKYGEYISPSNVYQTARAAQSIARGNLWSAGYHLSRLRKNWRHKTRRKQRYRSLPILPSRRYRYQQYKRGAYKRYRRGRYKRYRTYRTYRKKRVPYWIWIKNNHKRYTTKNY